MTATSNGGVDPGFACLGIDHLHFYLDDALPWARWYQQVWGFQLQGQRITSDTHSLWLSQGKIHLLLSHALHDQGPVADYLRRHPQGIADVALQISDAEQAHRWLTAQGQTVQWRDQDSIKHLQLQIPIPSHMPDHQGMDLCHSLIERSGPEDQTRLPGHSGFTSDPVPSISSFSHIDHVVINLPQRALASMADWYTRLFNWQPLYRYTVTTDRSGLNSIVMGPAPLSSPPLLIALNEPLDPASQIQEFMDANQGPGVQHVALHAVDILSAVTQLQQQGIRFLPIPQTYYQDLPNPLLDYDPQQLAHRQILVDRAQFLDQLLLQIFTQPLFPEPTFFYEIIQRRCGAQGFGEANFQALFAAIERQQQQRSPAPAPAPQMPRPGN